MARNDAAIRVMRRTPTIIVGDDIVTIDGLDYTFGDEPTGIVDMSNAVRVLDHDDYQIDKIGDRYLFTDYESGQWWLVPLPEEEKKEQEE